MWPRDPVMTPEMESIDFSMPQRSRLYRLRPMGVENGKIEGMVSYLVRLAGAHSVSPRRLIKTIFASDNEALRHLRYLRFFTRDAGTINSLGKYASLFQDTTHQLVGGDLKQVMNLMPLKDLLPFNGSGLLAPRPKWCPCCIGEMVAGEDEAYRPLVWSFALYRVCTRHDVQLLDKCHHCGKHQPFIPRYPDLAHCDHCGKLLDSGTAKEPKGSIHRWTSAAIANLVLNLASLEGIATTERFTSIVKAAVNQLADGNRAEFCKRTGLSSRWVLKEWISGHDRPTLPQILSISYSLGVYPAQLLQLELSVTHPFGSHMLRPLPQMLLARAERPMLENHSKQEIAKKLEQLLKTVARFKSLSAVAASLGISRSTMKYWFPEEYAYFQLILEAKRRTHAINRSQFREKSVISAVQVISELGQYPSRRKVNQQLSVKKLTLAKPDAMKTYRQFLRNPANS